MHEWEDSLRQKNPVYLPTKMDNALGEINKSSWGFEVWEVVRCELGKTVEVWKSRHRN